MTKGFPGLPVGGGDARQVAAVVNRLAQGKLNCTGSLTLAAGAASTTVNDPRATAGSIVLLMPTTANAAAELGNGTLYVSARAKGSFTLVHANNAQTDRAFDYALMG
jgi:hypothetical protein